MSDGINFTPRHAWGTIVAKHEGNLYMISRTGVMSFDIPVEKPKRRRRPSLGERIKKILNFLFP